MTKKIFMILLILSSLKIYAKELIIYSAAGLIKPMEMIIEKYESQNNIKINTDFAGSGTLYGKLSIKKNCDIYFPTSKKYTNLGVKEGVIDSSSIKNITEYVPVILLSDKCSKEINSLKDLEKKDLKIAIGDPEAAAIGKITNSIIKKNRLNINENIVTYTPTINQLFLYAKLGRIDATIITENWLVNSEMNSISIPKEANVTSTIPVSITSFSKNKTEAEKFIQYLNSKESEIIWNKWGFKLWKE